MKEIARFISALFVYGRILSLDVVAGAVLMAFLAGHICHHFVDEIVLVALGLSVWLIYTLDHLFDASQIPHQAHTPRHRFHQQYFVFLAFGWFLALGMGLVVVAPFLPLVIWKRGLFMLGLVGGHFILSGWGGRAMGVLGQKETRIALFYSLGVLLPVFEWHNSFEMYRLGWLLGMFFGLAWVNLLLISFFELSSDTQDQQFSTARTLGLEKTRLFIQNILWLGSLWWLAGAFFLVGPARWYLALLGLMGMSLWLVYLRPNWFASHEYYRIACDVIFCYPALLLFT